LHLRHAKSIVHLVVHLHTKESIWLRCCGMDLSSQHVLPFPSTRQGSMCSHNPNSVFANAHWRPMRCAPSTGKRRPSSDATPPSLPASQTGQRWPSSAAVDDMAAEPGDGVHRHMSLLERAMLKVGYGLYDGLLDILPFCHVELISRQTVLA
jgi:hypothetical protein